MPVHLKDHDLTYWPVPKTACTSLKHLFFEIENGHKFTHFRANGQWRHIHNAAYPTRLYSDWYGKVEHGRHRITIVRDPIRRFVSAYANRVIFHRELSEKKAGPGLRRYRVPPDPDLQTFTDNLYKYMRASALVRSHVRPAVDYLGKRPEFFSRVFRFDEIPDCVQLIHEITGSDVALPHEQTGGPKLSTDELSAKQIEKLKRFYRDDYKIFGSYF